MVLLVVLLIFGGSQLPKMARNLGRAQQELKKGFAEANKEAEAEAGEDSAK
ncbi:MAG: twin-arginine translocase TatA/TatE family subunit [Actinomycetota bacterium]